MKLGVPGSIRRAEVDTSHFKGNFPESCSLEACYSLNAADANVANLQDWKELLPRTKLKAHSRHIFRDQLVAHRPRDARAFQYLPRRRSQPPPALRPARAAGASPKGIALLNQLPEAEARKRLPRLLRVHKMGERNARAPAVRRPRTSARRSGSNLGRSRSGRLARSVSSPSPDRRQQSRKKAIGRGAPLVFRRAVPRATGIRRNPRAASRGQSGISRKIRNRLSHLRDGQIGGRNSRKRARPPRQRSGHRTPASPPKNSARSRAFAWRNSSPREPPMSQITTHVLDVSIGRPAAGVPVVLAIKKAG